MKDIIKQLFSESSGISSMRVMSMIALLIAGTIALLGLYKTTDLTGLSMLVGAFLASAFGGKVFQKAQEIEGQKQKITEITNVDKAD